MLLNCHASVGSKCLNAVNHLFCWHCPGQQLPIVPTAFEILTYYPPQYLKTLEVQLSAFFVYYM